jgi:uncharacterized protein YcbK (DUF882 family)
MKRRFEGVIRPNWLGAVLVAVMATLAFAGTASAETRSLKLYFIHTKERAEIVYKRNGRYDQAGLKQINRFLRDWRKNEPANMDPRLLDLVWEVYRSVGARDHIHVVSAYRSPATNAMLRSRSSGVAQKSQHTLGKAMDFYIPGVPLSKLRAAAFKVEGGGVGYYPKSGAPFVHLDVGNVRSWPRMSRKELLALFPDGKTMHLPADGKPLPGYNQALAAYQSRKKSGGAVHIASAQPRAEQVERGLRGGGLLAALFRGGADEEEDNSEATTRAPVAVAAAPARPAPAAPVRQPAEAPAETIVAALPERNAPLPGAAPRPLVDVGAPARAALVPGLPTPPAAAEAEMAVASVPLPTRRPDYTPEPQQVAAAELPASVDLPVAAITAERARGAGSDAIAEMLAASGAEVRADVAISPPVPSLRPRIEDAGSTQVAAAPSPSIDDATVPGAMFALAALPDTSLAPSTRPEAAARPDPVQVPIAPPPIAPRRASPSSAGRLARMPHPPFAPACAPRPRHRARRPGRRATRRGRSWFRSSGISPVSLSCATFPWRRPAAPATRLPPMRWSTARRRSFTRKASPPTRRHPPPTASPAAPSPSCRWRSSRRTESGSLRRSASSSALRRAIILRGEFPTVIPAKGAKRPQSRDPLAARSWSAARSSRCLTRIVNLELGCAAQ